MSKKDTFFGIGRKYAYLLLAFATCSTFLWFGKVGELGWVTMVTGLGGWYFRENRKQKDGKKWT